MAIGLEVILQLICDKKFLINHSLVLNRFREGDQFIMLNHFLREKLPQLLRDNSGRRLNYSNHKNNLILNVNDLSDDTPKEMPFCL